MSVLRRAALALLTLLAVLGAAPHLDSAPGPASSSAISLFDAGLDLGSSAFAQSPSAQLPGSPNSNTAGTTFVLCYHIANTRDGGTWPQCINIYRPAVYSTIQTIIPGATGDQDQVCASFHLCFKIPVDSSSQINWTLIAAAGTMVLTVHTMSPSGGTDYCNYSAFRGAISASVLTVTNWNPQYALLQAGQAINTGASPYTGTPLGVSIDHQVSGTTGQNGTYALTGSPGTVSSTLMTGTVTAPNSPTTTSCDKSETSGYDDLGFYEALSAWQNAGCDGYCTAFATYISGGCGGVCTGIHASWAQFIGKTIVGFSNGGMMVNLLWCLAPNYYSKYAVVSGPLPSEYSSFSCSPTNAHPYYASFGYQDPDLGILQAGWNASDWVSQNPTLVSLAFPGHSHYTPAPISFCAMVNVYTGASTCTGGSVPFYGDGGFAAVATHTTPAGATGPVDTWCYGGASCPMKLRGVYTGAHNPGSQSTGSGVEAIKDIDLWMSAN